MKKGDVSREVEDIGCLTWIDAFFFFFFLLFSPCLDKARRDGVIRSMMNDWGRDSRVDRYKFVR